MNFSLGEDVDIDDQNITSDSNYCVEAYTSQVNSHTEWDTLEEVVVGSIDGGVFPSWQDIMKATMPESAWTLFQEKGGQPFPREHVAKAAEELNVFSEILQAEGIKVVRPEPQDHGSGFSTSHWAANGGLYSAMPRDCLMVVGDTIIEAPMAWRCRYFETNAFRKMIKTYFLSGARWVAAPKPQLTDALYNTDHIDNMDYLNTTITEFEPVFDAADFVRFGKDILVQKSHVTNEFGINWLQRTIGKNYNVHCIKVNDPHAMHIDATIVPLAPGKLLVNPERFIDNELFRDWEIIRAPNPVLPKDWPMYFSSPWLSMNTLSLDEKTVVVERQEKPLINLLTSRGFRCIPVDFRHFYSFGGSFHCATLDIRRQSTLRSYL